MPWQTQMKTLSLMQSTASLQIIAARAEKLNARQAKMLLKTSINILSENEEIKSQRADHGPHTPLLTLPSNTYLYYQHLTSKFDPKLASELVEGKKGQGLDSPGKPETNCLIKLLVFLS